MTVGRIFAAACLFSLLSLWCFRVDANPGPVDDSKVAWAYGMFVDSVTVTGNKHTKDFVILREMQTQPGDLLVRETFHRDMRFVSDMTPFSSAEFRADSLGAGHCAIRIHVRERAQILIKAVLPQVRYDFERGFTYGVRWNDQNFRGRLEQTSLSYNRNEKNDENINFGWATPWIGWRHISVGTGVSYYNRGDEPYEISVLERLSATGYVGVPLTESRIMFSQLLLSLTLDKSRTGGLEESEPGGLEGEKELSISPLLGYRFDSRDSPLRPTKGWSFGLSVRATCPLDNGRDVYYRLSNDVRRFIGVSENSVIGLLSALDYQFGDFPGYSYFRLGGPSSLRGQPSGRFKGYYRWYQTVEWRYQFLPRMVFRAPVIREFDVGLGLVTFIDSGIVWNGVDDFGLEQWHGTAGVGLLFFSPIQDVIRLDFGFSAHGDYRFHTATGIRF